MINYKLMINSNPKHSAMIYLTDMRSTLTHSDTRFLKAHVLHSMLSVMFYLVIANTKNNLHVSDVLISYWTHSVTAE